MPQQIPEALIASLQSVKGFDVSTFKEVHQSGEQVTSIRFNPAKIAACQVKEGMEKIPWSSNGYYLDERPSFTIDPLFHAGTYYVQEASSMFIEEAIRQLIDIDQPLRVLDLCAAPGGKSTLLQSVISPASLLVSNEVIKSRCTILTENIIKWGAANVVITNNDAKDFQRLPEFFDLVIVDAPCSGSGLFRKDPAAIGEWSLNNVALCGQRQERILADILPSLKPGGTLLYSTCSYSEREDEAITDWLLTAEELTSVQLKIDPEWHIVESTGAAGGGYGYRFYPDKLKGEGFFIAAFRKNEALTVRDTRKSYQQNVRSKPLFLRNSETTILEPYFNNIDQYRFLKWQDEVLAIPSSLPEDVLLLQSLLYLKKAGVKAGSIIRNELLPDHELAMSANLSHTVPCIELDRAQALQYLRRHDLNLDADKQGWTLCKYENIALGWAKFLPNRMNNYYPKGWRILNK